MNLFCLAFWAASTILLTGLGIALGICIGRYLEETSRDGPSPAAATPTDGHRHDDGTTTPQPTSTSERSPDGARTDQDHHVGQTP